MPTFRGAGDAPVVQFDPTVEISPFTLFRRLSQGTGPRLVDVRIDPDSSGTRRSLAGAETDFHSTWTPAEAQEEVVFFDDDGTRAVDLTRQLQAAGFPKVKALFGGLDLYEFSLDPEIVGSETYLVRD